MEKSEGTSKRQIFRLAVGIILSLIALVLLFSLVDFDQVVQAFSNLDPIRIIPLALILILAFFLRSYSWRVILREKISLKRSFFIINAGYLVNTILPFRLGEVARTFLLLPYGFGFWEAFPTIVLERMFDLFFGLSLFFIGLPFALGFDQDLRGVYLFAGILTLGIVTLILLFRYRERFFSWLDEWTFISEKFRSRLRQLLTSVFSGIMVVSDPGKFLRIFVGMAGSWGLAYLFQYFLFLIFFPGAEPIWIVFTMGVAAIGISVPSSPGNVGLYEASMTLALSAFGVDHSLAFTYAVTSHVLNLVIPILCGPFGLVKGGVKIKDIWQLKDQQKKEIDYE